MKTTTHDERTDLAEARALIRRLDMASKLVLLAELESELGGDRPEISSWEAAFLALRADPVVQEPANVNSADLLSSMRR